MGKQILCLHGWSYQTDKWEMFLKELRAEGFNPLLLKIPGLTAPEPKTSWSLTDYVNWLDKEILKIQGTDKTSFSNSKWKTNATVDSKNVPADKKRNLRKTNGSVAMHNDQNDRPDLCLLGHSNGGRIATAYAAKYPQRISSLILIDSAGIPDQRTRTRIKKIFFLFLSKTGKLITQSGSIKKIVYKLTRERDYYQASKLMKQTMINLINVNLGKTMHEIRIPTLIIWGENDKMTPLSCGKLTHKNIRGSKFMIVKNAGHAPHFTHYHEVAQSIKSFLLS